MNRRLLCTLIAPLSLFVAVLSGCQTEGRDADCPEMPITDRVDDPALLAWREEAEAKGCVTPIDEEVGAGGQATGGGSATGGSAMGGAGGQGGVGGSF